jgi:hypothetical protein
MPIGPKVTDAYERLCTTETELEDRGKHDTERRQSSRVRATSKSILTSSLSFRAPKNAE